MTTQDKTITDGAARQRLNFLGFTESDAQLLRELRPWTEGVVQEFSKNSTMPPLRTLGLSRL